MSNPNQAILDERNAMRDELIVAALAHIPFDGWGIAALRRAAQDRNCAIEYAISLFPDSAADMIGWHCGLGIRMMQDALASMDEPPKGVTAKIAHALETHFTLQRDHRLAIARAASWLALPTNLPMSMRLTHNIVDSVWYYAGDKSTDHNYYTKRSLLGMVYLSTLPVWLNDQSDDLTITKEFMHRRIANVLQIGKRMGSLPKMPKWPINSGIFRKFKSGDMGMRK